MFHFVTISLLFRRKGEAKAFLDSQDKVNDFLKEFNLLDARQFPAEQVNL